MTPSRSVSFATLLAHPFLFAIGVARHLLADQFLQRRRYRGAFDLRPLPPFDGLAFLRSGLALKEVDKLTTTACDGWFTHPRNLRDLPDTPAAEAIGLDGGEQPTLLVAQGGQERDHLPVVNYRPGGRSLAGISGSGIDRDARQASDSPPSGPTDVEYRARGRFRFGIRLLHPVAASSPAMARAPTRDGRGGSRPGRPAGEADHRPDRSVTSGRPDRPPSLGGLDAPGRSGR